MNSMPEPSNDRTSATDVEHDDATCTTCNPSASRIDIATVREFARRAAGWGFAIDPDGEPAYLVERINALLAEGVPPTPPESEWFEPPVCEPWCTGRHDDDGQFRDCSSEEFFVPQADDKVAMVCVESTFNRVTSLMSPVRVRVEDFLFHPKYARQLAELLIRAADLAEA
jgi:hypothetical protein